MVKGIARCLFFMSGLCEVVPHIVPRLIAWNIVNSINETACTFPAGFRSSFDG